MVDSVKRKFDRKYARLNFEINYGIGFEKFTAVDVSPGGIGFYSNKEFAVNSEILLKNLRINGSRVFKGKVANCLAKSHEDLFNVALSTLIITEICGEDEVEMSLIEMVRKSSLDHKKDFIKRQFQAEFDQKHMEFMVDSIVPEAVRKNHKVFRIGVAFEKEFQEIENLQKLWFKDLEERKFNLDFVFSSVK